MFPRAFSLFFLSLLPLSLSSFHLSLSFYALKFVSAQRFSASLTAAALASQASNSALSFLFSHQKFVSAQRFSAALPGVLSLASLSVTYVSYVPSQASLSALSSLFAPKNLFRLNALTSPLAAAHLSSQKAHASHFSQNSHHSHYSHLSHLCCKGIKKTVPRNLGTVYMGYRGRLESNFYSLLANLNQVDAVGCVQAYSLAGVSLNALNDHAVGGVDVNHSSVVNSYVDHAVGSFYVEVVGAALKMLFTPLVSSVVFR